MKVIMINGYPRCGKDTFMEISKKHYKTKIHSTIDTPKDICTKLGWNGEKDDKSRAMLVDLKKWWVKYLDGSFTELTENIKNTYNDGYDFFITTSREGEEIHRLKTWCDHNNIPFVYVFINRDECIRDYGNTSDNQVRSHQIPDIEIDNNSTLEEFEYKVLDILEYYNKKI